MTKRFLGIFLFVVVIIFGVCGFSKPVGAIDSIGVNEFFLSPTGSQWLELANSSGSAIDLSNWGIRIYSSSMSSDNFSINNAIIPAGGLFLYNFDSSVMDISGGAIFLLDAPSDTNKQLAYGSFSLPGQDHADLPGDGESALIINSVWSTTSTPTKGWFNNASGLGSSGIPPELSAVQLALNSIGISTNIADLSNPLDTTGLYFSKVNVGKIQFDDGVNLSDSLTVEMLKNLNSLITFTTGTVALSGDGNFLLKNTGATITLYGLSGVNYSVNDLIIKNDSGSVIASSSGDYPVITNFNFDIPTQSISFHTNHFTSFSVLTDFFDVIAPTVSFTSPTPVDGFLTNQGTAIIKVSSTENMASAIVTVNGTPLAMTRTNYGSSSVATYMISLTAGSNTYRVAITDLAGNPASTASRIIAYDNTIPTAVLSGLPATSTYDRNLSITVGGTDVVYYRYNLDNRGYGSEIPISTVISNGGLTIDSHNIKVIGRDLAGNWQTVSTNHIWTILNTPSGGGGSGGGGGGGSSTPPPATIVPPPINPIIAVTSPEQPQATLTVDFGATGAPAGRVLGVKTYPNGSLIRSTTTKKIYVLLKYQKKWITTLKELRKYANKAVNNIDESVVATFPDYRVDGTLIKGESGKIFVIKNGRKQHIRTLQELKTKYRGKKILDIGDNELSLYREI